MLAGIVFEEVNESDFVRRNEVDGTRSLRKFAVR